jgi:hypothetical protein
MTDVCAPIEALGVVTRNRPEAVVRCLRSFGTHLRSHGRRARMLVVDSSDAAQAEQGRGALAALAGELATEIRWVGSDEKRRLADRLARTAAVDPELVRFALFDTAGVDHDIGGNRNCLLLLHAGQPFLSADDDMVCDLRRPAGASPAVAIATAEPATSVTLHRSFSAARASLAPSDACVLEMHERVLGRAVKACLQELAAGGERGVTSHVFEAGARVGASFGGYFGDSGTAFPGFYLWSDASVRTQLLALDEDSHRELYASRQIVRVAGALTISKGAFSMFSNVALDATQTLPPFFPVLRGEDLGFGSLVRRCLPHLLFAYVPQALAHRPWEARRADPDQLWDPTAGISMAGILRQCLDLALPPGARPSEDRLAAAGRSLRQLAGGSAGDFRELLRSQGDRALRRSLTWLEGVLDRAEGSPVSWADGLRGFCAHHRAVLASPDLGLPLELVKRHPPEEATALMQRLLTRYGELLEVWPELFSAARRLAPS